MIPTMDLRFVERTNPLSGFVQKILQQKWTGNDTYTGQPKHEWRDVPIEKE